MIKIDGRSFTLTEPLQLYAGESVTNCKIRLVADGCICLNDRPVVTGNEFTFEGNRDGEWNPHLKQRSSEDVERIRSEVMNLASHVALV